MHDGTAVTAPASEDTAPEAAHAPARPAADLLPPEMLAAAVAGDGRAVALLLSKVHPQVERFCRARLGRRETILGSADDVAQDVCMAVLAVLPDYQPSHMSFRAFVFGIARHKIADAFRAMARNRCDAVEEVPERVSREEDPVQVVLDAERNDRLGDLMGLLGPRQVEILTLRIAVGLTAEETAETLGSTPGAVRVAQHRALQRLRRELDDRAARRAGTRPAAPAPRRRRPAAVAGAAAAAVRPAVVPAAVVPAPRSPLADRDLAIAV
ncbi:RNA polymerase sigma factor ShbA [Pseudonocardia spirodelae]|uniref:RNA polymerase sigma factor ShbA n=1 Tax=Pseudonocardia spirodelae TaxID=3133431 RepID=A0ABU8T172_9PSEU